MGVLEIVSLTVLSVSELLVFVANALSNLPNHQKFGFKNTTGEVSNEFYTQITPAGYTFAIWSVIYLWDILWIIYGWSFVFQPKTQPSIFVAVYWLRVLVNILNIAWLYVWDNKIVVGACVILYAFTITFYVSNIAMVVYFNSIQDQVGPVQRILTNSLPINGMFFYTTWVTIASQINLTTVLSYFTQTSKEDSATIGLTILLAIVVGYFILEVSIAETYLRYVFSVYPVLIWASIGVLVAHWNDSTEGMRNKIYTLIILVIVSLFLVAKIYLSIMYSKFRPINRGKNYNHLKEHEML